MSFRLPQSLCTLAIVTACLVSAPTPAVGGEYDFDKFLTQTSPWAGHGVGSGVHRRTTTDMKIPQMPGGGRKTVTEEKQTLSQITATEYVIKVESKTVAGWRTTTERVPKVFRVDVKKAKITDAGDGTVTIGGTSYPCKKKKIGDMTHVIGGLKANLKGRGGRTQPVGSGMVWIHATHGLLKMQSTMTAMGKTTTNTMIVTNLSVSRTVGKAVLACREYTMTNSMGFRRVSTQSMKVPGALVLATVTMKMAGFSMDTREELLAYVKKPLAVTTGAKPKK